MRIKARLLFLIFLSHFNAVADSQFGVAVSVGQSPFLGDLSGETSFSYEVQIHTLFYESTSLPLEGFVAFEAMFVEASLSSESVFPFSTSEKLRINTFLIAPTVCNVGVFQFCLGLGQGTVNINQNLVKRDYGTWNYRGLLRYQVFEKFKLFAQVKYIGKVEIQSGTTRGHFTLLPITGGLAYRF